MKKKITLRNLKKIIIEETRKIIREESNLSEEKGQDSLDSQIDSYFSNYESEAKNVKVEGLDFRRFMRRFLVEAEKDEDKSDEDSDEKDDEEASDATSKEDEEDEPEKLTIDDVDVDSFADSVVRLVDNYDSLLEVRNTILRRAVNFLLKSYEPDVADAFKESLSEKHGMEVGKTESEEEDEIQVPAADRAGTSPGGA